MRIYLAQKVGGVGSGEEVRQKESESWIEGNSFIDNSIFPYHSLYPSHHERTGNAVQLEILNVGYFMIVLWEIEGQK